MDGITFDPGRIEAIKNIALPHNKKTMQSFLGKINFERRLISDFAEIVKPLQEMIKKDAKFQWMNERKETFKKIKEAIVEDPTLWSLNFDRDFILYTFALDHLIAAMLTQRDEVGKEFPVSFMSTILKGAKLNYPAVDKQDFTVFKAVKHF